MSGRSSHRLALRVKGLLGWLFLATGLHRRLLRDRAVVLLFHRVGEACPGDEIGMPVERFTRFCDFLARHFEVVSLAALVERLRTGGDLSGMAVITFDDGYLDNHEVAAPILRKVGLPASFFVSTGYIGTERVPGWDADQGVVPQWMTWEHVRDLRRQGFELGAHTVNHVNLGDADSFRRAHAAPLPEHWNVNVGPGEQAREVEDSKAQLERELGAPVTAFAYPFGRRENLSENSRRFVREAGFTVCVSAVGGTVVQGTAPLAINRVPVSQWIETPAQFLFELATGRL